MNRGDRHDGRHDAGRTSLRASGRTDGQSSHAHRQRLEALFSSGGGGGPAAAPPRAAAGGDRPGTGARRPLGRTPSEYRMRLERLRIAREPEQVRAAADTFLAHHQLPDDLDVLLKVLQHPDEKVLREALGHLSSLMIQGRMGSTLLLATRLDELAGRVQEPVTQQYIEGLRAQIARRA